MPVCVACGSWGVGPLCRSCRLALRPGGELSVAGIPVAFAMLHRGPARQLVHRLKYHGLVAAADVLAAAMAERMPIGAACLVPVPRAVVRRLAYGVDPARELALRIAVRTGIPVIAGLAPPLWWPRHATREVSLRRPPEFRRGRPVPGRVVLVDDVFTTGTTLLGASRALGHSVVGAVVATSPGRQPVGPV